MKIIHKRLDLYRFLVVYLLYKQTKKIEIMKRKTIGIIVLFIMIELLILGGCWGISIMDGNPFKEFYILSVIGIHVVFIFLAALYYLVCIISDYK